MRVVWICILVSRLAIATQGETPAEWADRAEQLIRQNNQQAALDALAKAAKAIPATAASEDRIGFLLAVLKQQTDAITHFHKAISLDPDYAPAHFHLGVAMWQAE